MNHEDLRDLLCARPFQPFSQAEVSVMDWEVVWTEPAVADLEPVVRTVARQNPINTESLRAERLESVEVLIRFPLIGPTYERDRTSRIRVIL